MDWTPDIERNMSQPRPAPSIELRPWREADWPLAFRWALQCWRWIADDSFPKDQRTWIRHRIAATQDQEARDQGMPKNFGVYRDGELGGILMCEGRGPWVCQAHCIFKRGIDRRDSFWGHQTTVPALQLGIEKAWEMGYTKVQAVFFDDHRAMIRLMEELDAVQEAIYQRQAIREGEWATLVGYAIFREE